jgi:YHS domain-containing protein
MFRVLFELLVVIMLITVLRSVIGIIGKALTGSSTGNRSSQRPSEQVPLSGELKKDPSCGTYISAATSIQENVGGETFYFCSKQCRDKYVASLAR